jgi:peptidyl-prolyl cis-trans isomerase C
MRRPFCFISFGLILFSLVGCGEWGRRLPDHILARVNEEAITVQEFNQEFKELAVEMGSEEQSEGSGDLRKAYLDQVIERKILAQEARRLGMGVSREEVDQAIAEIKKDYPRGGFDERLGLLGMTLEEWKGRLEEKLLAEKMIRTARQYEGKIGDEEALTYYNDHRASFKLDPKVRARQIVVTDGEEAIQILKRLKRGEKFEKLAREKSVGPEKANGGDLGYFSRGEKPPEFDMVFTLEVGAISGLIRSPYGYHIFKLDEKIEPRDISFEEAKPRILQELKQRRGEEKYERWLRGIKEKAKVEINRRLLQS